MTLRFILDFVISISFFEISLVNLVNNHCYGTKYVLEFICILYEPVVVGRARLASHCKTCIFTTLSKAGLIHYGYLTTWKLLFCTKHSGVLHILSYLTTVEQRCSTGAAGPGVTLPDQAWRLDMNIIYIWSPVKILAFITLAWVSDQATDTETVLSSGQFSLMSQTCVIMSICLTTVT